MIEILREWRHSARTSWRRTTMGWLAAFFLAMTAPAIAWANTITVNTLADPGRKTECSLRSAILSATKARAVDGCKSGTGADTIELSRLFGVLTLHSPLEVADGFVTIVGSPSSGLIISGGKKVGIFRVSQNAALILQQLSFQDARAPQGSVIFNNGGVVFIGDVEFNSSRATGTDGSGGAIYNFHGDMTMVNAFLRFNSAVVGGAIENLGTMRIFHSEVGINNADNGGAIANIGGSLHISRTTVSSNSTNGGHGGGFYIDGGDVSLTDSIVTGNKALGSKGQGGGAYVLNGALKVSHSVFIANKGMGAGGGIANLNGDANIINSTFWANDSKVTGGAISNQAALTVTASTIAFSQGGGGIVSTNDLSSIRGTILAENVGGNCKHVANAGNNISDDDTCGFGNQTGANGKKIGDNVDPQLTNLGFNGGPTQTVPIATGSPASGAIPLEMCTDQSQPKAKPITTDQRGFGRPSPDHPNACDIGAFEAGALPPS